MIYAKLNRRYAGESTDGISICVKRSETNIDHTLLHFRKRHYSKNNMEDLFEKYFSFLNDGTYSNIKLLMIWKNVNLTDFVTLDSSVTVAYYNRDNKLQFMGNCYTIGGSNTAQHCYTNKSTERRQAFMNIDSIDDIFRLIVEENRNFPE